VAVRTDAILTDARHESIKMTRPFDQLDKRLNEGLRAFEKYESKPI
jgi:hypothetical protein